jgi:hypothetical protein
MIPIINRNISLAGALKYIYGHLAPEFLVPLIL